MGVTSHMTDLISLGAHDYITMLILKKLLERFQAKTTTAEEDEIVVRMQELQELSGIDTWTGRPPANGWPGGLFQKPASSIPNITQQHGRGRVSRVAYPPPTSEVHRYFRLRRHPRPRCPTAF